MLVCSVYNIRVSSLGKEEGAGSFAGRLFHCFNCCLTLTLFCTCRRGNAIKFHVLGLVLFQII